MAQFCDKTTQELLSTFNPNILDSKDITTQAAYYDLANNKYYTKEDNILFQLIKRHYISKIYKPIVKYVGGPMYLTRHNGNINNTLYNIYLFGEMHAKVTDCPSNSKKNNTLLIENYLEQLIDTTDVFLDIYFEFPGFHELKYNVSVDRMLHPDLRLGKLFTKFSTCIQTLTRKANICKTSRIHYIDARRLELLGTSDVNWLGIFILSNINRQDSFEISNVKNFISSNKKRIQDIFKSLLTNNIEEYKQFWILQIYQTDLVSKELSRSFLKKDIFNFIKSKVEIEAAKLYNNTTFYNFVSYLYNNINNVDKKYLQYLKNFDLFTVPINSLIVDTYTLSRIFKEFNIKNKLLQPVKPQNIIVYAGDAHCDAYRDFFDYIGLQKTEESGISYDDYINNQKYGLGKNIMKNCLDMSNIKQPIF